MSSLTLDFHTVCSFCRDNDCDNYHRCGQCTTVDVATRKVYLKHCASLKTKRKYKAKAKAAAALPIHVPDVVDSVSSPAHSVSPAPLLNPAILPVVDSSASLDQVKGEILSQVKGLFDLFAESLECHFTRIEGSVSEVASSRDLPSILAAHVAEPSVRNISDQDVSNMPSFSAPSVVAGRAEPTPDGAPLVLYPDGLRAYRGVLAATVAPSSATSPPRISFSDPLMTVRVLESSSRILDSFLESLRGSIVFLVEHDFAIGGDSLVESLHGFSARIVDPVSPLPGPSQGGDCVSHFLCSLVGGFASASPTVAGVADVRLLGFPRLVLSSPLPFLFLLLLPCLSLALLLLSGFSSISSLFLLFLLFFILFYLRLPLRLPPLPLLPLSPLFYHLLSLLLCLLFLSLQSLLFLISSLGCSSLSSFASVTLSSSVTSWSSPLVVSPSLAPISSFPWPVVPPVSSVPPFPTPVISPVSSLFAPAPVPSTVTSLSSSLPPPPVPPAALVPSYW